MIESPYFLLHVTWHNNYLQSPYFLLRAISKLNCDPRFSLKWNGYVAVSKCASIFLISGKIFVIDLSYNGQDLKYLIVLYVIRGVESRLDESD